jgi:hypothetical protein
MSKKDELSNIDVSNDFGFSFVSDDEVTAHKQDIDDLKDRLSQLRQMFLPLLENLNKNPDKDMIKWPNRKDLLDKQIKKLKTLTDT